jgi:mandelamide amidase
MSQDDLLELSASEAVSAMREGALHAETYASALLERCEVGRHLNAFITLEPERVLEAARAADRRRDAGEALGALHGLPIPIKDSVNTKDLPTTGGTLALRGFRPQEDAPIVRALLDAGGIVLGKTNLHELSFGWTSNNLAFGAVRNPYDPSRIPGGSTGGTAAAVAARMAPLGVAEDTEGSIRVPAALCGIAGFRPTTGRYPSEGVLPITPHFDQVGPHARTVRDLVLFDSVVTGDGRPLDSSSLKGLRLAIDRRTFFSGLDPEVERVSEEALRKLGEAGVHLVEVELPDLARFVTGVTIPLQLHDVVPAITQYLADYGAGISFDELFAQVSADVKRVFELYTLPGAPQAVSEETYRTALALRPELQEIYRSLFRDHDVRAIVFPTTLVPALPIGEDVEVEIRGEKVSFQIAVSRNIAPGSTAGVPGLVLPSGVTREGLPVSLELDGPAGEDRGLLALGLAVEAALGRLPPPRL